jgi:hypothetical protein
MSVKIYYLENDGIPFYIGKTTRNNDRQRLYAHRCSKQQRIDNLVIIDEVNDLEWRFWESHYIWLFRSWGFILENKNFGGGGPTHMPEHIKEERRQQRLGILRSEEVKQKMRKPKSSSIKGPNHGLSGTKHSDKHKQNKSIAAKNIVIPNRAKKVEQIKNGQVINTFISAAEADRYIGKKGVKNVCNGYAKSAGGYQWQWKIK